MKKSLRIFAAVFLLLSCAPSDQTNRAMRDLVVYSPMYNYGMAYDAFDWSEWTKMDNGQALAVTRFWGGAGVQFLFKSDSRVLFDKITIDRYAYDHEAVKLFAEKLNFLSGKFGTPYILRDSESRKVAMWKLPPGIVIVLFVDTNEKEVLFEVRMP